MAALAGTARRSRGDQPGDVAAGLQRCAGSDGTRPGRALVGADARGRVDPATRGVGTAGPAAGDADRGGRPVPSAATARDLAAGALPAPRGAGHDPLSLASGAAGGCRRLRVVRPAAATEALAGWRARGGACGARDLDHPSLARSADRRAPVPPVRHRGAARGDQSLRPHVPGPLRQRLLRAGSFGVRAAAVRFSLLSSEPASVDAGPGAVQGSALLAAGRDGTRRRPDGLRPAIAAWASPPRRST